MALAIAFALLLVPTPAAASTPPAVGGGASAAPHLLLIHGGSFLYEDPTFESLTRAAARAAGFIPHYLRYPLGDMPAAFQAARAEAIRLRARYGSAVYAYGSSAGGTLAVLLAGDGLVSAAVAKAPPTDLLGWRWPLGAYGPDYYQQIGLTPAERRTLSPLRRPARRPLLLVHGRRDRVVPVGMSRTFAAKFERVHLWVVRGGHHTERARPELLNRAFEWLTRATTVRTCLITSAHAWRRRTHFAGRRPRSAKWRCHSASLRPTPARSGTRQSHTQVMRQVLR